MPPRGRPTLVVLSLVISSSVASFSSASSCDAAACRSLVLAGRSVTSRQNRVFLVVLSLAPLATSRSAVRPWPVPRVSVRRVVPSNSGRRARMRSASGGTKPREFCTPRCAAGLTESGSSRLLLLPQQQSAAALIRKLMTSSTAGGIRAATAGVRLCTATCPRLRTMCARIG